MNQTGGRRSAYRHTHLLLPSFFSFLSPHPSHPSFLLFSSSCPPPFFLVVVSLSHSIAVFIVSVFTVALISVYNFWCWRVPANYAHVLGNCCRFVHEVNGFSVASRGNQDQSRRKALRNMYRSHSVSPNEVIRTQNDARKMANMCCSRKLRWKYDIAMKYRNDQKK